MTSGEVWWGPPRGTGRGQLELMGTPGLEGGWALAAETERKQGGSTPAPGAWGPAVALTLLGSEGPLGGGRAWQRAGQLGGGGGRHMALW